MPALLIRPKPANSDVIIRDGHTGRRLLVGLSEMLATRSDVIGARATRLSLAARSGLPIPSGSVLTASALGPMESKSHAGSLTSADAIDDVFEHLGRDGQMPLMVSASAVSDPGSGADRIIASHALTSRAELLHTIRRLSATASFLGDTIAIVIQRDIEMVESGTLTSSTSSERVADSIREPGAAALHRQLTELGRRVAKTFHGERAVAWGVDSSEQLWVLDIGDSRPAS